MSRHAQPGLDRPGSMRCGCVARDPAQEHPGAPAVPLDDPLDTALAVARPVSQQGHHTRAYPPFPHE